MKIKFQNVFLIMMYVHTYVRTCGIGSLANPVCLSKMSINASKFFIVRNEETVGRSVWNLGWDSTQPCVGRNREINEK